MDGWRATRIAGEQIWTGGEQREWRESKYGWVESNTNGGRANIDGWRAMRMAGEQV